MLSMYTRLAVFVPCWFHHLFQIGDVRKIDIGHDGKWPLSGWHLNKVMVQNLSTNHSVFFHCNRWLDAKHGRRVVLTAGSADEVEHQYQVGHIASCTGEPIFSGLHIEIFLSCP